MAETDVTATDLTAEYLASLTLLTQAAADVANGNRVRLSGNDLVIAHNTGASDHTVTITSVADAHNRSGTITGATVAAGTIRCFRVKNREGWESSGYFLFSANHAEVKFSIIRL